MRLPVPPEPGLVVVHLAVVAGWLLLVARHLRTEPDARGPAGWTAGAALIWVAGVLLWPELPAVRPLHEGHAERAFELLAGRPMVTGWTWEQLGRHLLGDRATAEHLVRTQILVGGVGLLGLGPVLRRLAGPWGAGALVVALVCSTAAWTHLVGDTEAPMAWALMALLLLPAWRLLSPGSPDPLAWAVVLGLTACLGWLRVELIALPLGLLVWAGVGRLPLARRAEGTLAIGLLVLLGLLGLALSGLSVGADWTWAQQALDPRHPSWASLPPILLAWLPAGVAMLTLLGVVLSLARPLRTGGLGLTVLLLWGLYVAAAHGGSRPPAGRPGAFELARYASLLLPVWWILAALGWRALSDALGRRLMVVAVIPALPWLLARVPVAEAPWLADAPAWPPALGVLDRDMQRQALTLQRFTTEHPDCGVVGATARWGAWSPEAPPRLVAASPGPRGWRVRAVDELPDDACLAWMETLDCTLLPGDPCARWRPSGGPVSGATWAARPDLHPHHRPATSRDRHVALWWIRLPEGR